MTYDRTAIMNAAWTEARYMVKTFGYSRRQVPALFRNALIKAWDAAKKAARLAALSVSQLTAEILGLENTEYLGSHGLQTLCDYRAALARLQSLPTVAA
jgi:hypothetical protein